MNKILGLIGLARKARLIVIGADAVVETLAQGKAALVVFAGDIAQNTRERCQRAAGNQVPCVALPCTREQLGGVLGRQVCAVAALTDAGMAKTLQKRLEEAGQIGAPLPDGDR